MVLNGDVPLAGGELLAAPAPPPRRLHRAGHHHHRRAGRPDPLRARHARRQRRRGAHRRGARRLARGARGHRDQRRLLRVRRGRVAPLPADSHGRQRPGRVLPDRSRAPLPRTPATGWPPSSTADVEASMGVNSRVELAQVNAIMRGPHPRAPHARRRDDRRPVVDLRRLGRHGRARHRHPSADHPDRSHRRRRAAARWGRAAFWPTSRSTTAPRSSRRT